MSRKRRRRRIAALVAPLLEDGEELLSTAAPWGTRLTKTRLLFAGRHVHHLALTDRRLLAFSRRHRGKRETRPVLVEPIAQLTLEGAHTRLTLFQVLIVTSGQARWVFEFRRRDHATGHALVRMLHAPRQASLPA